MVDRLSAERFASVGGSLLESPLWDADRDLILWLDLVERRLGHSLPNGADYAYVDLPEHTGCIALAASGDIVEVGQTAVRMRRSPEADARVWVPLELGGAKVNDGKVAPDGSLWFGTATTADGAGALYRLDATGSLSRMLESVEMSNGLGWSPSGSTMYYVDTTTQAIDALAFTHAGGIASRRRLVDVPSSNGMPDGLAVDSHGGVWLALWGGGAVHRYSSDGELQLIVEVPTTRVTSCAFAGDKLDWLVITTAVDDPLGVGGGGDLYRVRAPVSGLPVNRYGG